jgi:cold shock CspA family protein
LGKRVAIASIKACTCAEFSDPRDEARVKDFDIIWLDELLEPLQLTFKKHYERCQSPLHTGNRVVITTYYPSRGEKFYCDECRTQFAQQKKQAMAEVMGFAVEEGANGQPPSPAPLAPGLPAMDFTPSTGGPPPEALPTAPVVAVPPPPPTAPVVPSAPVPPPPTPVATNGTSGDASRSGQYVPGVVKITFPDRGYGFIHGADGRDYFFHLTDLRDGVEFTEITDGTRVLFEIKREPSMGRAGAAQNIRARPPQPAPTTPTPSA